MKTISTRLGHSSVAFTMDTYAHLLPGMQKSAMEKFEEALTAAAPVAPKVLGNFRAQLSAKTEFFLWN